MTLDQYLLNISISYKNAIAKELYEGKIDDLTEEMTNQIAHKTGLMFILEKDVEGNICMANSKEVRPEFRQTFSPTDILDYFYGILHSSNFRSAQNKSSKINLPYPKNAEIFWKLVEIGSQIKQIHSLENLKAKNLITYHQKIKLALLETEKLIKKIDEIKLE